MKMKPEIKALWTQALRSGKYTQGHRSLHPQEDGFCCLGVLCDISGIGEWGPDAHDTMGISYLTGEGETRLHLPRAVREWAGLDDNNPLTEETITVPLSALNDEGKSFEEIANIIERDF